MKKILMIAICAMTTFTISAQKLSKGHNYKSVASTEEINANHEFQGYINEVKDKIAVNDRCLSQLQFKLYAMQEKARKKTERKLNNLTVENNELKNELDNFIKYGIGDWKLFKSEFSQSLSAVQNDLYFLGADVTADELLANSGIK
jgi:hypothetical protein